MVVFSLRLMSSTTVMVHPVSYGGETFLPCVYGYACTVRRTQGLTLCTARKRVVVKRELVEESTPTKCVKINWIL